MIESRIVEALKEEIEKAGILKAFYTWWVAPEDADLPYGSIGSASTTSQRLKGGCTSTVQLSVHVWHDQMEKRREVSQLMAKITTIAARLEIPGVSLLVTSSDQRILTDTTTSTPYLHGVLYLDFLV